MTRGHEAMGEVRKFLVEVHKDENGYWAEVADLPGCFAAGRDVPELFEALGEAIGLYLTSEAATVTVEQVDVDLPAQKVPILATLAPAGC